MGSYVEVSCRCSSASAMYCEVSTIVIPEPLSAGFMVMVGSCMRSLRAVCWSRVRFLPY